MSEYDKLEEYLNPYVKHMESFIPIEKNLKKLLDKGLSKKEIEDKLKNDSYIIDYVPDTLFHGSVHDIDVLNPNESTQAGSHVYATDNPVHALFFSIFNNSSICRGRILEDVDDKGSYSVKFLIDERVEGAIEKLIEDKDIYIYVLNGKDFYKPHGEAFITREWVSKDGKQITPVKKLKINVKEFFKNLEDKGLVEYSYHYKGKDLETVCDFLGQNYAYGLFTERAKDMDEYDSRCDKRIKEYFPEYLKFSKCFRLCIKDIMDEDLRKDNPDMTVEEEKNIKLRKIRLLARSCHKEVKDENGKIISIPQKDAIDKIMKRCEEKGFKR